MAKRPEVLDGEAIDIVFAVAKPNSGCFVTIYELQNFWGSRDKALVRQKTIMMFCAGVILGVIAPYNTDSINALVGRFIYWVGNIMFASVVSGIVARWVFPPMLERQVSAIFAFFAYTAILSVPTLVWVASWELILKGLFVNPGGFTNEFIQQSLASLNYGVIGYFGFYARVWFITILLVGPISLIAEKLARQKKIPTKPIAESRFLKRVPNDLGSELLCLSMEDHYLRVYTSLGNTLILMRMSDAVAELEDYDGMQVHRSWWVAKAAIKEIVRAPRKKSIILTNDIEVPISQRREKVLKEAGFI
ncbi:MAG: LytTR family DNA-binding domain-containing protein [Kordiimonas sp.]